MVISELTAFSLSDLAWYGPLVVLSGIGVYLLIKLLFFCSKSTEETTMIEKYGNRRHFQLWKKLALLQYTRILRYNHASNHNRFFTSCSALTFQEGMP
jgi:hypothetical protein